MKDVENLFKRLGTQTVYKEYGVEPVQDGQERWSLLKEVKLLEAAYSLKSSAASNQRIPTTTEPAHTTEVVMGNKQVESKPQTQNLNATGFYPKFLTPKTKESTVASIIPPAFKSSNSGGPLLRSLLSKNEPVQVTKMQDSTVVRVRPSLVFNTKRSIKGTET